ncbi:TIM-barrel domain-containing protein [Paenibacillus sp. MMS20-IR301]|uniref:glycoside hydrolase family 31 protein n=1 Tax=Paenibacillus sp. MMS20-IR301 TaxID=2895946 RepID=UPI0028E734EA|nr:TIM-barrel domain-containing protein [Paenibacillus sp. MMS20-IR301]WNS44218.1 glycoside hydrolase family 31 protein [Paenibacillus sp. MMS20-IR301]
MTTTSQELQPLPQHWRFTSEPAANPGAVVQGDGYRFTVLTSALIRMEYSPLGSFEDRATQIVVNRSFEVPEFRVNDLGNKLEIITARLQLTYDKEPFSRHGLSVKVRNGSGHLMSVWHYGDEGQNLGGTARTLDNADGAIPLEQGLLSLSGYTVVDDSRSLLLEQGGTVQPRGQEGTDLYLFGYGHDYLECLKDFYQLCGRTPLLPRYALGNWWSRYYPYSEEEYMGLIERFGQEQIPFSVAVMDMDWHLVDVDPQYGSGWTGYSWNRELFPDPQRFLGWLHDRGLRVTLNVHPADGVRAFEEPYLAIAADLGMDPERGDAVEFDITDSRFLQAYFKFLHHPLEEEGVDFWWIDWQQGGITKIPGLDPLWMLNHYHYLDSGRRGRRPLTFSRYAGLGSHRYPVGFSGDTIITWESLAFQPYFTANASNAGYGWWSHDIGGHMGGYLDDELTLRWVQFGVFSPLLRLHSSASAFNSKEPWRFNPVAEAAMKEALRLRHRLLPYLYTMNRYASRDGLPLVQPMYYRHAEQREAYEVPNQYYFGTELIACPITQPAHSHTGAAEFKAWLPEGLWIDFFSGRVYDGGRRLALYRNLQQIPVLAKAGAIVPMTDLTEYTSSVDNPQQLEVRVFAGAVGRFQLWEDAGDTAEDRDEHWCVTGMTLAWGEQAVFTVHPAEGNTPVIPERRSWKLVFTGIMETDVSVTAGGVQIAADTSYDAASGMLTVTVPECQVTEALEITLAAAQVAVNRIVDEVFALLNRAQIRFELKEQIYRLVRGNLSPAAVLAALASLKLEAPLYGALCEILSARL